MEPKKMPFYFHRWLCVYAKRLNITLNLFYAYVICGARNKSLYGKYCLHSNIWCIFYIVHQHSHTFLLHFVTNINKVHQVFSDLRFIIF